MFQQLTDFLSMISPFRSYCRHLQVSGAVPQSLHKPKHAEQPEIVVKQLQLLEIPEPAEQPQLVEEPKLKQIGSPGEFNQS